MHAVLFNKTDPINTMSKCDINTIDMDLWGTIIPQMCVLIIETENLKIPKVVLTIDLIESNTLNVKDIQSNIITKIHEITTN